jgi:hypothetical protein
MNIEIVEFHKVTEAVKQQDESQIRELQELQLAFIGGGIGDPIAY